MIRALLLKTMFWEVHNEHKIYFIWWIYRGVRIPNPQLKGAVSSRFKHMDVLQNSVKFLIFYKKQLSSCKKALVEIQIFKNPNVSSLKRFTDHNLNIIWFWNIK